MWVSRWSAAVFALCAAVDVPGAVAVPPAGVTKVTTMLKDMVAQLRKEADEDQEIAESMHCWCATNSKEKAKSVENAKAHIADLTTMVEQYTAEASRLKTEIEGAQKSVAENTQSLEKATSIRKDETAKFQSEEKEMVVSIQNLKSGITTLSKHHSSFLQQNANGESTERRALVTVADYARELLSKQEGLLAEVISPAQRRMLINFVQQPNGYFDSNGFAMAGLVQGGAAPASGQIFGILKQMRETFEGNVVNSQKEETANQKAYEDMKLAKEGEIAAGTRAVETKTDEIAVADEKCAQSKEDLEDTQASMEADEKFLADLEPRCESFEKEYDERTQTRNEEIQAVSKALEFLTSDDAADLFSRTMGASLLQRDQSVSLAQRSRVARVLEAAASKSHDPRLSTLAMTVRTRIDAFGKVREGVQEMIAQLTAEKEDEVKKKDWCIGEMNDNQRKMEQKERDQADSQTMIADMANTMDQLARNIEQLKEEIVEIQVQAKKAGLEREAANKGFQDIVADQRATQQLLAAAVDVLEAFYAKQGALIQVRARRGGQPAPPGFKNYEKNAGGNTVIRAIQSVIVEAKAMEMESLFSEKASQKAYEDFMTDTNEAINEKSRDIVHKIDMASKAEQDKVEAELERDRIMKEMEDLDQEGKDLHSTCDFYLDNFEVRMAARDEEIEALKNGVQMLSGASFSALVQNM